MDILRGTLDLLVLKALEGGPRHGYAVSKWIDGATDGELLVEEGSLYPALHRIQRKGWIESRWGQSETGRRARFYDLTAEGRKRLDEEIAGWWRYSAAIDRAVATPSADEGP